MSWLNAISAMAVCAGRCPGLVDLGRLPSESEAPIAVQTRDYRQGHAQTPTSLFEFVLPPFVFLAVIAAGVSEGCGPEDGDNVLRAVTRRSWWA